MGSYHKAVHLSIKFICFHSSSQATKSLSGHAERASGGPSPARGCGRHGGRRREPRQSPSKERGPGGDPWGGPAKTGADATRNGDVSGVEAPEAGPPGDCRSRRKNLLRDAGRSFSGADPAGRAVRTLTQPVRDGVHARCDCIWFADGEGCAGGEPLRWLQPPSKTEGKHPEGVTPDKLPNNPARDAPRPPSSLATRGGRTPETGGGTVLLEVPEGCRPPGMSGTTSGGKAHVLHCQTSAGAAGELVPAP